MTAWAFGKGWESDRAPKAKQNPSLSVINPSTLNFAL